MQNNLSLRRSERSKENKSIVSLFHPIVSLFFDLWEERWEETNCQRRGQGRRQQDKENHPLTGRDTDRHRNRDWNRLRFGPLHDTRRRRQKTGGGNEREKERDSNSSKLTPFNLILTLSFHPVSSLGLSRIYSHHHYQMNGTST